MHNQLRDARALVAAAEVQEQLDTLGRMGISGIIEYVRNAGSPVRGPLAEALWRMSQTGDKNYVISVFAGCGYIPWKGLPLERTPEREKEVARHVFYDAACDAVAALGIGHATDVLSTIAFECADRIKNERQGGSTGINDREWREVSVILGNNAFTIQHALERAVESNQGAAFMDPRLKPRTA
jgi:hypothetical protein